MKNRGVHILSLLIEVLYVYKLMLLFRITHWYKYHLSHITTKKKITVLRINYIIFPILPSGFINSKAVWIQGIWLVSDPLITIERVFCTVVLCLDLGDPVSFILRKRKQLFDIRIFLLFCHALQNYFSRHSHTSPIMFKHIYYRCLFMTWFQRAETSQWALLIDLNQHNFEKELWTIVDSDISLMCVSASGKWPYMIFLTTWCSQMVSCKFFSAAPTVSILPKLIIKSLSLSKRNLFLSF